MTTNHPHTHSNQPDDPSSPPKSRLLLVDDHEAGRRSLARLLDAMGYEVVAVGDGASALDQVRNHAPFDILLTDVRLPDIDGRQIVMAAHEREPKPWSALITGWDVEPNERERLGLDWIFLKPVNIQEVIAKLKEI